MGLFDRFRSSAPAVADSSADVSGQDSTRLIEAGHGFEAQGRLDEAMQCYLDAIPLAPNPARAHLNHGNVLLLKGDLNGALEAFRTALKHKPDYAGAYYNIGNALLNAGQLDEAAANYRRALEIHPDYAEVHCSLGVALKELGQLDGAIASLQRALAIKPDLVEAQTNLENILQVICSKGTVLLIDGKLNDAIVNFRRVLEINPDFAEAHRNLGEALQNLGRLEEAVVSYCRALEINPNNPDAHYNLACIFKIQARNEDAAASCRRALEIKPDFADAYNNLGIALQDLGQTQEAVACYRRALEITPSANTNNNLGTALQALGQTEDALACYQRALEISPYFGDAQFNLSLLLLSLGKYAEAWPKYEFRYHPNTKTKHVILPDLPFPRWQGESLDGKSLMIWPEQGFGDEIQFARYIPMLKSRGVSRITLVCAQPLMALLQNINGVDILVTPSKALSIPHHAYWTFPMSLPLHFATTVETIPAKLPYLSVLSERLDMWRNRLPKGGPNVGLVWKGNAEHKNDANRSLPGLSTLAPLWSLPGVTFVSLQKGQGEDEAATPPTGQPILHLGSGIQDFADTAAIVAQLDLVICIDTAIAHLAGALGKPCWVLLSAIGTDWRWLRERTDSPWYPGVIRLFRQSKAGDWATTINEVAHALEAWADERAKTT